MAHRIDTSNRAIDLFGTGKDGFATPSPPTTPPTTLSPDFANMLQQEITNTVEAAGLALVKADNTQLLQAIIELASNNIAISNWTRFPTASGFTGVLFGIAFGDGVYVACGESGEIQTSPDLTNWTRQTADASYADEFACAAHNGTDTFVVAGQNGGVQYSTDAGVTWNAVTLPGAYSGNLKAITWDGTRFVLVGASGGVFTSTDGITWTARTPAASYSGNFFGVVSSDTRLVAVGSATGGFQSEIQTSDDGGSTWTRRNGGGSGTSGIGGNAVGFGNGLFVMSGSGNALIFTSPDGIAWTSHALPDASAVTLNGIAYDGERYYVGVGGDTSGDLAVAYTSTNGTTWTKRRIPLSTPTFPRQLVFDGSAFAAAGGSAAVVSSLRVA